MAKKKDLRGRADSDVNAVEKAESQKGLSQGAWVTIGTIAAAIITGVFALITHLIPLASPSPLPSPTATIASSTPGPVAPLLPVATTADAIAGKWSGMAKDSNGTSFQITLDVRKSCSLKERCGSISVSHVPCEGEIFLEKTEDDGFEFRVTNFYGRSNRDVCQPGAGEHFKLRPDGKLAYTTTYEPEAQGILARID
jgi:hypothetical protein